MDVSWEIGKYEHRVTNDTASQPGAGITGLQRLIVVAPAKIVRALNSREGRSAQHICKVYIPHVIRRYG